MPVDMRTRIDGVSNPVDPSVLFTDVLPAAFEAHAEEVGPGLEFLRLRPLTLEVDGEPWTLTPDGTQVVITRGAAKADKRAVLRLSAQQLADIVDDQATIMSLWVGNTLDQPEGQIGHLLDWWLVLRAALDGTPIYTPGSIDLSGYDLTRSFRPDDDRDEMFDFLNTCGFMHIKGLFTADEMNAISADMDRAAPSYTEGDGRSWWARTDDGVSRLVRMQGFDTHSDTATELLADDRFLSLAEIGRAGHEFGRKRANNRLEGLFKPIGVVEGISDITWHKDCSLGRHSYDCCGMTVGISVTGADETSGQLRVIAGSHRALVWAGVRQPRVDLPDVPLATDTGDITIHLSCTMHTAQPPTERPRRVMYSGFSLPPLPDVDPEALAAARARLGAVRESAPLTVLDKHFKS